MISASLDAWLRPAILPQPDHPAKPQVKPRFEF